MKRFIGYLLNFVLSICAIFGGIYTKFYRKNVCFKFYRLGFMLCGSDGNSCRNHSIFQGKKGDAV